MCTCFLVSCCVCFLEQLGALNFFENVATVQFDHRMLAYSTVIAAGAVMVTARRAGMASLPPPVRKAAHSVTGMAATQAALGISTLMLYVPTSLASLHQVRMLCSFHRVARDRTTVGLVHVRRVLRRDSLLWCRLVPWSCGALLCGSCTL